MNQQDERTARHPARDVESCTFRDLCEELGATDGSVAIWQMVDWWLPDWDESDAFQALVDALNSKQDALPLGVVVETARRHLRDQQESLENRRRGGEYTDRGVGEIRVQVEREVWAQRWRSHGMTAPVRGRPRGRTREHRPRSRRVARTSGSRGDPHLPSDDDPDLAPGWLQGAECGVRFDWPGQLRLWRPNERAAA